MPGNPFHFTKPTNPEDFIGRFATLEQIINDLYHWDGESFGIVGGRRFGKTSILRILEDRIIKKLKQVGIEDIHVVPIYISLKSIPRNSPEEVLGYILHRLRIVTSGTKKSIPLDKSPLLALDLPEYTQKTYPSANLQELEAAIEEVVIAAHSEYGIVRIALLIDEIDSVLDFPWTNLLLGNLRSLIYDGEMMNFVRLVLAGSGRYMDVDAQGSPLSNAIRGCFLEPFTEDAARELVNRAHGITREVADEIIKQSGGHPFIMQHLLYYIASPGNMSITVDNVHAEVRHFFHDSSYVLESWWKGIGEDGQRVYCILRQFTDWVTIADLIKRADDLNLQVDRGLKALCNHGIVLHDGTYKKYCISGQVFRDWANIRCQKINLKSENSDARAQINATVAIRHTVPLDEDYMPFSVFISYSHQDRAFCKELEKHLSNLRRQNVITSWFDGDISPGTDWKSQIIEHLNSDHIILLLISADFMASDFCYSIEMTQAIARHNANQARVLPIILRPTDWQGAPFAKLKILPIDGKAVTRWPTHDDAFEDIVQGIRKAIDDLMKKRTLPHP